MKRRFNSKRRMSFLSVFLLLDLIAIFAIFRTSGATFESRAIASADMSVALYAFELDDIEEIDGNNNTIDGNIKPGNSDGNSITDGNPTLDSNDEAVIDLGVIKPGNTKYYKFSVSNYYEEFVAQTDLSYELKIITTTNLPLEYSLYEGIYSSSSTPVLSNTNGSPVADEWGTYFRTFALSEKCMKHDEASSDNYVLKVVFPDTVNSIYKNPIYQNSIESIKIQVSSRQVLMGDPIIDTGLCD